VFGDRRWKTTVVLLGDSHALAWFPALSLIARREHWRVVDFTKDGCPPEEVNVAAWFRDGAPYWECIQWRATTERQIAALHPTAVIMANARYLEEPEARPLAGVPTEEGDPWLDGLAAIFGFLRGHAAHVIFISDVPTLAQPAPACVSAHTSEVQACSTPLASAVLLPTVRSAEIALAKRDGVTAIDPVPWFCTTTVCPVIVKNILLYRDNAHMVPAWSRFIAPVLAASIVPVIAPHGAPSQL
jgi:hypothetical protein